ncbi:MAG: hypothetical protein ABIJ48_08600 [Actinomycetota bacterium]
MTFRPEARLDTSRVGGRRRMSSGQGATVGGEIMGIIALVPTLLLGGDPSQLRVGRNGEKVGEQPPATSAGKARPVPTPTRATIAASWTT